MIEFTRFIRHQDPEKEKAALDTVSSLVKLQLQSPLNALI